VCIILHVSYKRHVGTINAPYKNIMVNFTLYNSGGQKRSGHFLKTHNTIACDSILYTRRTECERQKAFSVKRAVTGTR